MRRRPAELETRLEKGTLWRQRVPFCLNNSSLWRDKLVLLACLMPE